MNLARFVQHLDIFTPPRHHHAATAMDVIMDTPNVSPPSPQNEPAALPGAPAPDPLDRILHAEEARLTSGLSVVDLWLAYADWALHMANAPAHSATLGMNALEQWQRYLEAASGGQVIQPAPQDHRFHHPLWQKQPYNLLYQGFLLAEEWLAHASDAGPAVSRHHHHIVSFMNRQWLDMLSPSNIPWLNPEVIEETATTHGDNVQKGWQNLLADVQTALGATPDGPNFTLGQDLAATAGKVIFRNELMELIQYEPMTDTVKPEPVLIVPAWIMKYYILDLSPQNSLIAYLVAQGYTVFIISWRNPGPELQNTDFDDYRRLGPMAALEVIQAVCGDVGVHGCGYCLGGTLLSITAAAMARDQDHRIKSLTLFAAQTDFTEAGELQLFISEGQLSFLEDNMAVHGVLDSQQMAGAFQMLRSNDLVWSRMINHYMLGHSDTPNDMMAWNADGTRMPAQMHSQYLRRLFLGNDLAEGRLIAGGRPVALHDIRLPIFIVGTETDHIAPWRSVYKLHLLNASDITFVLTSGGHNAGIVSEPGHPHRSFQSQFRPSGSPYRGPDEWLQTAIRQSGSWWPCWANWLGQHNGTDTAPPAIGAPDRGYAILGDAPGTYVLEQ